MEGNAQGGFVEFQGAVRRDGKPFVITSLNGEQVGQLTPAETLNMGIRAIQAAQEAERDAALLVGAKEIARDAGDDGATAERYAAGLLALIRDKRGQVDPDPRADHPSGS